MSTILTSGTPCSSAEFIAIVRALRAEGMEDLVLLSSCMGVVTSLLIDDLGHGPHDVRRLVHGALEHALDARARSAS